MKKYIIMLLMIPMLSFSQVIKLNDSCVSKLTIKLYQNKKLITTIWTYKTPDAEFELDDVKAGAYDMELKYISDGVEVIEKRKIKAIGDNKKKK